MSTKPERRKIKRALEERVRKDLRMVTEIKRFPFRARLKIAWAILRGEK